MLDLPRYLLGVAEIGALVGFATLGASALRARLLPGFSGVPAHLATAVLALALLLWAAELLGSIGLLSPGPYLILIVLSGGTISALIRGWRGGGGFSAARRLRRARPRNEERTVPPPGAARRAREAPHPGDRTRGQAVDASTLIALVIAALAAIEFGLETKSKLGTGMTGFDSTWYHGPFAAGFFQSGDTWGLHYIAPQFLAWFYPANSELLHAVGMLAFDRDLLSPLLNLSWFVGCLLACWCIGRPYGAAPWSLALGAVALSVPAFADQAGEARNDIVGTFFLLAAVAIAMNARLGARTIEGSPSGRTYDRIATKSANAAIVVGLAAGLAAGTKLNFLLPAAVLVIGLAVVAPSGGRWRSLALGSLAALAGGGYWYLRNLVQTGNPLPWIDRIGPISLPAPDQALGGREGHSVLGYLFDGAVWSDWFLPGLHDGLWILWPLVLVAAFAGIVLCLLPVRQGGSAEGSRRDGVLLVAGLTGLAAALAWLIAPTSASGPEGMPRGFESGLRYLAPALVLGFALLPVVLPRIRGAGVGHPPNGRILKVPRSLARHLSGRGMPHAGPPALGVPLVCLCLAFLAVVAIGCPVQRHYLENRYADPSFAAPGLNAAFKWSRSVSGARIATTSTRQYPLYGTDLSNRVEFVGEEQPNGGFTAPATCRQWRRLLNAGDYDYVVTSRDRIEPNKPPYPPTATWTEAPNATEILREPPTVVFKLSGSLDPSACR